MNFIEAITWAKKGNKIRTKYSGENYYQMCEDNEKLLDQDLNHVTELNLGFILNDYNGWEFYEED